MSMSLPHEHVFVRLGVSQIEGIGVFAIRPIPKGTNLFPNDCIEIVWVERAHLDRAGLTPAQRALYHDFGIVRGDQLGCPINFNNLTPGWYLNEPAEGEEPNVMVDEGYNFFTARDIAEGEELCVRYGDFSDRSH